MKTSIKITRLLKKIREMNEEVGLLEESLVEPEMDSSEQYKDAAQPDGPGPVQEKQWVGEEFTDHLVTRGVQY